MVDIKKDKKGNTWILTKIDNEGFHKQLNLTFDDMVQLKKIIKNIV